MKNQKPVNQTWGPTQRFCGSSTTRPNLHAFIILNRATSKGLILGAQEEETVDRINLKKIIDSILKDQKKMQEELVHLSKIAYSSLQVSLSNQTMISTLWKAMHDSPGLE